MTADEIRMLIEEVRIDHSVRPNMESCRRCFAGDGVPCPAHRVADALDALLPIVEELAQVEWYVVRDGPEVWTLIQRAREALKP